MTLEQIYFPAIIGNCSVIAVCLIFGRRVRWLCRLALLINATIVAVGTVVLFWLSIPINEGSGMALLFAFRLATPFLLAILALFAINRWRMRPSEQNTANTCPERSEVRAR